MRLESLELQLEWKKEIQLESLSSFIVCKLEQYGSPLRWAITSITCDNDLKASRYITLEAVVIIP